MPRKRRHTWVGFALCAVLVILGLFALDGASRGPAMPDDDVHDSTTGRAALSVAAALSAPFPALLTPLTVPASTLVPSELGANNAVVDTISGSGDITHDGAATYQIPLWTPPGRAGVQPTLSLSYGSHGGNGPLGVGWSLGGLPRIERCRRSFALDGAAGPVEFGLTPGLEANQRFCLQGERLVPVRGPQGGDHTEYRTQRDSFARIVSYVDAGGVSTFRAYTKDGLILTFGEASQDGVLDGPLTTQAPDPTTSEVVATTVQARYAWGVTRVEDRSGNDFVVRYERVDADWHPAEITYNEDANGVRQSSVKLLYERRPDRSEHWIGGFKVQQTERLHRLEMHGPNPTYSALLRAYQLSYRNDSITGRSLLSALTACDKDGACLRPTTFDWTLGSRYFTFVSTSVGNDWEVPQVGDLDADGRDELVYVKPPTNELKIAAGKGNSLDNYPMVVSPPYACSSPNAVSVLDLNGDGRSELWQQGCNSVLWSQGVGNGAFEFRRQPFPGSNADRTVFADLDADGDGEPFSSLGPRLTPGWPRRSTSMASRRSLRKPPRPSVRPPSTLGLRAASGRPPTTACYRCSPSTWMAAANRRCSARQPRPRRRTAPWSRSGETQARRSAARRAPVPFLTPRPCQARSTNLSTSTAMA